MMLALVTLLTAAPPELGTVTWGRDFDEALQLARSRHKPVLVLFDEVPGCSTVLGFGKDVLSDPRTVARLERDYVLVAVFNNVGGKDKRVLESFGEPAWNNPVVRIIDADRRALSLRFDGPYTVTAFNAFLDAALTSRDRGSSSSAR